MLFLHRHLGLLLVFNNSVLIQWIDPSDMHDITVTFPTSFTEAKYYCSNQIWIDQIGHVSLENKTISGVKFKCNSRHMYVGHHILFIGF